MIANYNSLADECAHCHATGAQLHDVEMKVDGFLTVRHFKICDDCVNKVSYKIDIVEGVLNGP